HGVGEALMDDHAAAPGFRPRAGGRSPGAPGSVPAGSGFARAVAGLEAVAAAAGLDRVGVVDGEAAAHELVDVVDLGSLEVLGGEAVDVDLEAAEVDDLVVLAGRVLVETHAVGEAGAPTGLDEDAQADRRALGANQLLELREGGVGDVDNEASPWGGIRGGRAGPP